MPKPTPNDPVMDALDALVETLTTTQELTSKALARAEQLRENRAAGLTYSEAVVGGDRPLVVEVMRQVMADLSAAAGRFQRAEAKALWEEGLTMERIAATFGITRQRVSGLLGAPGRRPRTRPE
ncbi:MAG TPA: hypothetical protein VM938_13990 [Acidimicrobiales bacterium]|nr:hypothetical protein [Acidimicrobiales bacterium]